MKFALQRLFGGVMIAVAALLASAAWSQTPGAGAQQPAFTQQELDQMLAPIALYPDALLTQVLIAATYPLEVAEAAHWLRARPGLRGEQAVAAAMQENWDLSVKSLLAFPEIIALMDQRLDWTKRLGDAFLGQEPHVMDSIQGLRQRAHAAGHLASDDLARVNRQGEAIIIEPGPEALIYLPYYDPVIVYGSWWWPSPPVRWSIWPSYRPHLNSSASLVWGRAGISARVWAGHFDWSGRQIRIHPQGSASHAPAASAWRHNEAHRRGVPYRRFRPDPVVSGRSQESLRGPAQSSPQTATRIQGERLRPAEARGAASLQINPHLGPRNARGEMRDGASLIINPHIGSQTARPREGRRNEGAGHFRGPKRSEAQGQERRATISERGHRQSRERFR